MGHGQKAYSTLWVEFYFEWKSWNGQILDIRGEGWNSPNERRAQWTWQAGEGEAGDGEERQSAEVTTDLSLQTAAEGEDYSENNETRSGPNNIINE